MPAVAFYVVFRLKKCKFAADATDILVFKIHLEFRHEREDAFFYRAGLFTVSVKNFQAVSPGELPFDDIHRVAVLIVNIVAVEL